MFIAFSRANPRSWDQTAIKTVKMLPNDQVTLFFEATAYATEEAITNALNAAETMTGANGNTVYAIPHDRLREVQKKYNRLKAAD